MRRRLTLVVLLFLALPLTSCLSPAVWDHTQPSFGRHPRNTPAAPCREVSRLRCDTQRCKGANMDWVDLQCAGGKMSRCVMSKGCGTGG